MKQISSIYTFLPLLLMGCTSKNMNEDTALLDTFESDATQRVQAEMDTIVDEMYIPGLSVAIINAEGARWVSGSGVSDYERQTEMTGMNLLKAGSITKTLTAARIHQLVEEQELTLEDLVSDHIPEISAEYGITIRHLLNHSSGLGNHTQSLSAVQFTTPWSDEELIELISALEPQFTPGTNYSYSNANFILLGMILTQKTNQPWATELTSLMGAAGSSTGYVPLFEQDWGTVEAGYYVYPDGTLHSEGDIVYNAVNDFHHTLVGAAGSLICNADDLARWGHAFWGTETIIRNETKDILTVVDHSNSYMGLGTVVTSDDYGTTWWHNGAVNGYESYVGYRPDTGVTLAIIGNAWLSSGNSCCAPYWNTLVADRLWEAYYQ